MLTCDTAEPFILQAVDGELAPAERVALDAHLSHCEHCRRSLREQHEVRALLATFALERAPSGFAARTMGEWRTHPHWLDIANWRWWSYRLLPLAASLLALALLRPFTHETTVEFAAVLRTWIGDDVSTSPAWAERVVGDAETDHDLFVAVLADTRETFEDSSHER